VEIQGFDVVPEAGDEFVVVADDKVARKIAETRAAKQREKDMVGKSKLTLESFLAASATSEAKSLNLVLKADVQGSLEAITEALTKLSTDEVKIQVVHGATGGHTESNTPLKTASQAIIIASTCAHRQDKTWPQRAGGDPLSSHRLQARWAKSRTAMSGMLEPDIQEVIRPSEVRNPFSVPKVARAGCGVVDGKLTSSQGAPAARPLSLHGQLSSLKRFQVRRQGSPEGYSAVLA
jgi:translation initiation factor IF-2